MENKSHINIIKGTTVLSFICNVATKLINERNKHKSAKSKNKALIIQIEMLQQENDLLLNCWINWDMIRLRLNHLMI